MMEQRINEGYVITDSVHVGGREFVIGQNETKYGTMYVTWACNNGDSYYWGHYFFGDQFAAQKDLVARAQEEVRYQELKRQPSEHPKPEKRKEYER